LSRGGDALGDALFRLAGLHDTAPARYHDGWYSRSNCLCPWGCKEGKALEQLLRLDEQVRNNHPVVCEQG
jgi:hypothetical protein